MTLGLMLRSILTPEQAQTPSIYFGAAIGITLLGWGIGGMAGGILADYIGRKRTMMLSVFFYALFAGITAFAQDFTTLAALRFITGLALGSEWSTGIALVAWLFPILAGSIVQHFGGIVNAALTVGSVYLIGLVVPWFMPETKGKPLPG